MNTPYGAYPFPREMRHGVWSVTKTAAGMLTLLRMAQKYGDEVLDYRIRDYLDVTATHDGWEHVTFRNAMSMATGIGTGTLNIDPNNIGSGDASNPSNNAGVDDYMAWYLEPTLAGKLDEVFKIPSYPWGPGEHARYRDRDIFTLSAALESFYKKKEGDGRRPLADDGRRGLSADRHSPHLHDPDPGDQWAWNADTGLGNLCVD